MELTVRQQSPKHLLLSSLRVTKTEPAGDRTGGKPERCDYAPLANSTYCLDASFAGFRCGRVSAHREVRYVFYCYPNAAIVPYIGQKFSSGSIRLIPATT